MLLFNKQNYLLALLFGVFIASCAFEPAWIAEDNKIKILWQRVALRESTTSKEFRLNRYLASRIGGAEDAEFFLEYELFTETKRNRIRILGEVKFSLIHSEKDTILLSSSVKDSLGYSDAILAVTDQASERDAYKRLMVLLGDRIVDELLSSKIMNDET